MILRKVIDGDVMKKKKNKNKIVKQITSVLLVVALVLNILPLDGICDILAQIFPENMAPIESVVYAYDTTYNASKFADKTSQTFDTVKMFEDFCYYYSVDPTFAAAHQNDTLFIQMGLDGSGVRDVLTADYVGLGTADNPFGGTIQLPATGDMNYYELTNGSDYPFFNYVYDSVIIQRQTDGTAIKLCLKNITNVGENVSKPVFAQHIKHDGRIDEENSTISPANWSVELMDGSTGTYSGVIGAIEANAHVNLIFANNSSAVINIVSNAPDSDLYYVDDVGAICGIMQNGSILNLTFSEIQSGYTITSANGNAGGLVGTMAGNAVLYVSAMPVANSSKSVISSSAYAGGLVGEMTSQASIEMANDFTVGGVSATEIPVKGSVTGVTGAGGLFGYFGNITAGNVLDIKKYNNVTTVYGQYCGGLFGVLESNQVTVDEILTANTFIISDTTDSPGFATLTVTSGSGSSYDFTGYFGGIAGKYVTDDLSNSLVLNGLTYSVIASDSFNAFGGAVGMIEGKAYVKAYGMSITAGGTNKRTGISTNDGCSNYAFFGGLVGATDSEYGDFIDLGDFALTLASTDASNGFCGGGVVGRFHEGVLRLSGVTNLSGAKTAGGYTTDGTTALRYSYYGQIIGYNDNVLVYALGDGSDADPAAFENITAVGDTPAQSVGWRFVRFDGSIADDLGTWGEVVRVFTVSDTVKNAEEADILTMDPANHTITVSAAQTSVGDAVAFAKTALNIQLNQGAGYDCLLFTEGDINKSNTLLGNTLTITASFSLSGTGINGLMRDGFSETISVSDLRGIGTFIGTIEGNSNTITLSIGNAYGVYSDGSAVSSSKEGVGQIYRHRNNGLFAVIGNSTTAGTVNSLTVAGSINVHNAGPDGMSIGGIAARSHGSTTLNSVSITGLNIHYHEGAKQPATEDCGKNIGGFIGYVDNVSDNGTLEIKGISVASPAIAFTGHHENWNVYGGAIGKIDSAKINILIGQNDGDKLTVGTSVDISDVTNVGENSDGGGLIGYIISKGNYATRTVKIKNLEFDDCKIGNAASLTGGGFLGYAWLNTTTTIDGLEVKGSSSINNTVSGISKTVGNVGAMLYCATGKMAVDSLTMNAMSMTNGAGTSLGMIVNKAYSGNGGLYLDVLNAGYTLTRSGITLPTTLTVYDEIAAYSASTLLAGGNGTGVVSIDMNSDRNSSTTKITTTGTYQNKLTSTSSSALEDETYANPNTRYYYNINHMSNSVDGENLLLWSLSKYAASNISNEFVKGKGTDVAFGTTLTNLYGTADLTGLSFYPLYNAANYEIVDLTLTFDYDRAYQTETGSVNGIATTTTNTDNYIRDPGEANQHYLMHSGLFMYLPSGKTITVSGALTLNGNFLEMEGTDGNSTSAANGYSGVLISRTLYGSINCGDSSSIVLNGIAPRTTGNAVYTGGYLLINNITRESDIVDAPSLNIYNIYTTSSYSSGSTYSADGTTSNVARSLCGAASGKGLTINFSHIKLDARNTSAVNNEELVGKASDLFSAYGTYNSIFTSSTFLASIYTDQAATLEYNYTYAEDWEDGNDEGSEADRFVTYGKEIQDSEEYKNKEKQYYGDKKNQFTNPISNADEEYVGFKYYFLEYVDTVYTGEKDSDGLFYREIKVNVMGAGLRKGCGTYNDPYIIDMDGQLEAVATFISSGTASSLSAVNLPKSYDSYDALAENTTGSRWCEDKAGHALYKPNDAGTGYESTAEGANEWSDKVNVRYYLANAYYKLEHDVTLDSTFVGLGGTEANFAFRGVIVGEKISENDTTPKYKIINKSEKPFINVTNGSVVKDINISVAAGNISLSQTTNSISDAYFGYTSQCKYYGGIMGEIMGGDNIIDNSYVSYHYTDSDSVSQTSDITLTGTDGTIVPVGGYVGVIVFGGLIFKNMEATVSDGSALLANNSGLEVYYDNNTSNNLASDTTAAKAAIYVNPIVGRVINGYAVNEGEQLTVTENGTYHDDANDGVGTTRTGAQHTLKNGKKHYSIADIKEYSLLTKAEKLDVTAVASAGANGNINVPNAQALFVLSLITQSTAGTAPALFETGSGTHIDETLETSRETDANGNITIHKTRTITDIDDTLCGYTNSLAYGTYGSGPSTAVYGMSHTATYSDVGTDASSSEDYSTYINYDTAAKTALPYIISHYTVGGVKTSSTTTEGEPETSSDSTSGSIATDPFTESSTDALDGKEFIISCTGRADHGHGNDHYYLNASSNAGNYGLKAEIEDNKKNATKMLFEKQSSGKYTISFSDNGTTKYLRFQQNSASVGNGNGRFLRTSTTKYEFDIQQVTVGSEKYWRISTDTFSGNNIIGLRNESEFCGNDNNNLTLYLYTSGTDITITTITTTITNMNAVVYPARCVTTTAGYYNINLTTEEFFQLPDSFRGLGTVGYYDDSSVASMQNTDYASRNNNKFCMKVDTFNGNNVTIDEDIYLNRYVIDNYFSKLHGSNNATQVVQSNIADFSVNTNTNFHGIGLFDSIVMKDADSKLDNFNLSGSVNTAIFSNSYVETSQEQTGANNYFMWHAVGGVVGSSINGNRVNFSRISLNNFSVRGSSYIGGLLGHSGNKSTDIYIIVDRCSASGLRLNLAATDDKEKYRDALGGFVGKVKEGGVKIYGTENGDHSTTGEYSLVELSSVLCVDSDRAGAGGLVGYAGNGCEAYDMHVEAASGSTVTIGGTSVSMVGGIVGSMQPAESKYSSCNAIFSNCVINEINLCASEYAGGIYGGAHNNDWSPYSIKVTNCKVTGNNSNNNAITAGYYSGGFIGDAYIVSVAAEGSANVEISDSIVSHYTISTTGNNSAAGGFIGYADAYTNNSDYANNSVVCYIHNSSVEDCSIAVNGKYGGGAIGRIKPHNGNKILGYNIKLDNVSSTSSGMGAWIGYVEANDNSTSIQFTGVGIYGNGFTQNVGNRANFSNASFVFADYSGACEGTTENNVTTYPSGVSTYNATNDVNSVTVENVDMPKYPYVNINSQSSMGIDEIISGDAAVLYGSQVAGYSYEDENETTQYYPSSQTMVAKIYSELNDANNSRRYTTYSDSVIPTGSTNTNTINTYLTRTVDYEGDRISTYGSENGSIPSGVEDFAVIVIMNTDNTETTNLINRYIQLVTNTTTDYTQSSSYYTIDISTLKYNTTSGRFEIDTTAEGHGLTFTSNTFALNGSYADSVKNTVTLIDVQFKDPFDTNKIAYHLYVPVYTIKEMTFGFHTTAITGTDSVKYTSAGSLLSSPYGSTLSAAGIHVDSLETWVTQYVRFTYSKEDINNLLLTGSLNWNFKKTMIYDTMQGGTRLPDGTCMILTDPNGGRDRMYYANASAFSNYAGTISGWRVDFNDFTSDGTTPFSVSPFKDILAYDLTKTEKLGAGHYTTDGASRENYDLIYSNSGTLEYYKYVSNGTGDYDFSVSTDINEDYYFSIYVPEPENYNYELYLFSTIAPAKISGSKTAKRDDADYTTYNMLIAELYKQTPARYDVTPDDQQMTGSNRTITVNAASTITITNADAKQFLTGKNLYHSFMLELNRYDSDGNVSNSIYDIESEDIFAQYGISQSYDSDSPPTPANDVRNIELTDSYVNVTTGNIMTSLLNSANSSLTVYAKIQMEFDDKGLELEFPRRNSGNNNVGVNVAASSNLAYDLDRLTHTSMSKSYDMDTHYYYIESVSTALLNYYAVDELDEYDQSGYDSKNMSRLGINGKSSNSAWMPINSSADYNVGVIDNYEEGDRIRLTLTLNKKTDVFDPENAMKVIGADYQQVGVIADYLKFTSIKSGNVIFVKNEDLSTANQYVYEAEADMEECQYANGYYHFDIDFSAKTGEDFKKYANYQVYLQAELLDTSSLDQTKTVENSRVRDYIVYTNAKVYMDVINPGTVSSAP